MRKAGDRSQESESWRLRVPALIAFVASFIICGALLGGIFHLAFAQESVPARDSARVNLVTTWNDMAASMHKENPLLEELQTNLQLNPPGRVLDARALERRRELYELVIAEHERQLSALKKLQDLDK